MYRSLPVFVLSIAFVVAACGSDDPLETTDAGLISLYDAQPPDAGIPDAEVCTLTECGTECVNTNTDNRHCGGCNLTCETPGQECVSGGCQCPGDFIPATISPLFDMIDSNSLPDGNLVLLGFTGGTGFHILLVGYDPQSTTTDVAIELPGDDMLPFVAAGYNVDPASMTVGTGYVLTGGTITFDAACAEGVSGTVTNATFTEAADLMSLQPLEGGCTTTAKSIAFSSGSCPETGADAGVPTADAGVPALDAAPAS